MGYITPSLIKSGLVSRGVINEDGDPNLVSNGDFFLGTTDWTLTGGWSVVVEAAYNDGSIGALTQVVL